MSGSHYKNSRGFDYRYYRVTQGRANPKTNDILSKVIPADMLEEAAIDVLKDALSNFTDVDSAVRAVVAEEMVAASADFQNVAQLRQDQKALEEQIDFYVTQMPSLGSEGVMRKTEPLRLRLLDIGRRIETAETAAAGNQKDSSQIVELVKVNCRQALSSLDQLSRLQVKRLLNGLIRRMTVDLETRETSVEIHMPSWSIRPDLNVIDNVCAVDANARIGVFGANNDWSIPIGTYSCSAQRVNKKFCMNCHRVQRVVGLVSHGAVAA
jgi:hypothetical protein